VFSDWDNCFAVQHASEMPGRGTFGCMKYFCGWCLAACNGNGEAHQHVLQCPQNPNKGSYGGNIAQFVNAQAGIRSQKVNAYLQREIKDAEERRAVVAAMSTHDFTPLKVVIK
jgi:hypothetical protein